LREVELLAKTEEFNKKKGLDFLVHQFSLGHGGGGSGEQGGGGELP
jgi:hypothetical protein